MKPPREGDIWDRIGHTEPKPIVNEVFTILIVWLKQSLEGLEHLYLFCQVLLQEFNYR